MVKKTPTITEAELQRALKQAGAVRSLLGLRANEVAKLIQMQHLIF